MKPNSRVLATTEKHLPVRQVADKDDANNNNIDIFSMHIYYVTYLFCKSVCMFSPASCGAPRTPACG